MNKVVYSNNFKENVKNIIKSMGLTQKEFAEKIGMNYGTWGHHMVCDKPVDIWFAVTVADELGEYVEDLCKGIL